MQNKRYIPTSEFSAIIHSFASNTLIHLYMQCNKLGRNPPLAWRNEQLIRYLKPLVKLPKNKPIKSHIKTLLIAARAGKNVEVQLQELLKLSTDMQNGVNQFYELLCLLQDEFGLITVKQDSDAPIEAERIEVNSKNIESAFDEQGIQVGTITLRIHSNRWLEVESFITQMPDCDVNRLGNQRSSH